jgi:hypothetical protein
MIGVPWIRASAPRYRIRLLGSDSYGRRVLNSIQRTPNVEIVSLPGGAQVDLTVLAVPDPLDLPQTARALSDGSHLVIVQPVCRPVLTFADLPSAQLRKGRFVQFGSEKRLIPELISLSGLIQTEYNTTCSLPSSSPTRPWRSRSFSEWGIWIDRWV